MLIVTKEVPCGISTLRPVEHVAFTTSSSRRGVKTQEARSKRAYASPFSVRSIKNAPEARMRCSQERKVRVETTTSTIALKVRLHAQANAIPCAKTYTLERKRV